MASHFSTADLDQWLAKARLEDEPSVELGLVGSLFQCILTSLKSLDASAPGEAGSWWDQVERFFLWGDGFAVEDGELDSILDKSYDLKVNVLHLLGNIGRIVTQGLSLLHSLVRNPDR